MSWKTTNPPKDGTPIVALGRVIFGDDYSTCVDPFTAAVYWQKTESDYEGWLFWDSRLSVARTLEDKVKIDFWIEYPGQFAIQTPPSSIPETEAA